MNFQPSVVDRYARLARLALTEEEKARFAKLPIKARSYLSAIEKASGPSISLTSTGPEREATIVKR